MKLSKKTSWTVLALVCPLVLAGCGAPDFQSMHPTTKKSTAEILLVNPPVGWSVGDVEEAGANRGVTTYAMNVSATHLQAEFHKAMVNPQISACIVVSRLPLDAASFSNSGNKPVLVAAPQVDTTSASANVAAVTENTTVSSYVVGWMLGQEAHLLNIQHIGVVAEQSPEPSMQAALAGLSQSNPGVIPSPVELSHPLPAGSVLPSLILAGRPLSDREWQFVADNGSEVASLSNLETSRQVLVKPGQLPSTVLDPYLASVETGKWQTSNALPSPITVYDPTRVAPSIATKLPALVQEVTSNPKLPANVYSTLPPLWKAVSVAVSIPPSTNG